MTTPKAYLFMLLSIIPLWILAVALLRLPSFVMPGPDLVARVLWEERDIFLNNTGVTLMEALVGYVLANVIAIATAVSFLYIKGFENFTTPWIVVIKNVPFVTIASLLIITLGDTPLPKVIIIILVTFFPILANLTKGLNSVDQVLLDRMQTLNASKWQVFRHVRWPSALPYFIAAHEISFTGSIIGAIVAEWLFAREGLGFLIVRSTMQYRADRLYAVTLIASLLAIAALVLVKVLEAYLFRWKKPREA